VARARRRWGSRSRCSRRRYCSRVIHEAVVDTVVVLHVALNRVCESGRACKSTSIPLNVARPTFSVGKMVLNFESVLKWLIC